MSIFLFKRTAYNCKQATLLALKKEENKISFFERLKLAYHLRYCDACNEFIAQSKMINEVGKKMDEFFFNNPPYILDENQKKKISDQLRSLDK